jgi:DNA polymerase-3 subunit epsilon
MPPLTSYTTPLTDQRFVAFDTETTGLWAASNRVIELAGVAFSPGSSDTDTFQELVNPDRTIPPEAIAVHGITDDELVGADSIAPVLNRFETFCGSDAILIAHNAPFDVSFVSWELFRTGATFGDQPVLDSKEIFSRVFPDLPSYSLLNIARHFGVANDQLHRALADSSLLHRLFLLALEKLTDLATATELLQAFSVQTITPADTTPTELPERFTELQKAIIEGAMVDMEYAREGYPPRSRVVRPLALHYLGSHLYLNAYCTYARDERTFRADRIGHYLVLRPTSG